MTEYRIRMKQGGGDTPFEIKYNSTRFRKPITDLEVYHRKYFRGLKMFAGYHQGGDIGEFLSPGRGGLNFLNRAIVRYSTTRYTFERKLDFLKAVKIKRGAWIDSVQFVIHNQEADAGEKVRWTRKYGDSDGGGEIYLIAPPKREIIGFYGSYGLVVDWIGIITALLPGESDSLKGEVDQYYDLETAQRGGRSLSLEDRLNQVR